MTSTAKVEKKIPESKGLWDDFRTYIGSTNLDFNQSEYEYAGFDLQKVMNEIKKRFDPAESKKLAIMGFYAGNNVTEKHSAYGTKILTKEGKTHGLKELYDAGILMYNPKNSSSLTLPRILQCFYPFIVEVLIAKDEEIEKRFEITLPAFAQTPALATCRLTTDGLKMFGEFSKKLSEILINVETGKPGVYNSKVIIAAQKTSYVLPKAANINTMIGINLFAEKDDLPDFTVLG